MSVKVMGRVWDTDLAPNHKLVLLAYADAAEHDGSQSFPGWERLAEMTGYSRSQIERITKELIDLGVLERTRRGRKGRRAEFAVTVSQSATQADEIVSHQRGDSVAQLRDTSRPDPSYTSPNGDGASIFEAFYEAWTQTPYTPRAEITKSMRARLNAAVKEATNAGIAAEQIVERSRKYRETWQSVEFTPQALLANWHRFAPDKPVAFCEICQNRGVVWLDENRMPTTPDDPYSVDAVVCTSCRP